MRIGHGFDAHKLTANRRLVLGGVEIPFEKGLAAHSDGDVVIHALCDALLGAAALGDIGQHFPDSDETYKNMDSREFLAKVMQLLGQSGYVVENADITIIAQAPKLAPFINEMRKNLCELLNVSKDCINIKATTTEGMGFTGKGEGIASHAIVLIATDQNILPDDLEESDDYLDDLPLD
jgi:2-C-methyl-D-erythritol 2,4-cyclodiphosphate synthase